MTDMPAVAVVGAVLGGFQVLVCHRSVLERWRISPGGPNCLGPWLFGLLDLLDLCNLVSGGVPAMASTFALSVTALHMTSGTTR